MSDDYEAPAITFDIESRHLRGCDVLSVTGREMKIERWGDGRRIILKGSESGVDIYLTEEKARELAMALAGYRVEIERTGGSPSTCKVWRDDVLIFDGQDRSALFREPL